MCYVMFEEKIIVLHDQWQRHGIQSLRAVKGSVNFSPVFTVFQLFGLLKFLNDVYID